jgi:glycosyltransferase involved in cell wall biosynthesis
VRRLRLLIFSNYFPPHMGGVEGYVSDLNDVLMPSGEVAAITVCTPRLPHEAPAVEELGGGYTVLRYPAFEPISNFPVPKVWKLGFWRALRAADPRAHDVLVSHTRFFLSSVLALLCARIARRPLLHVEHGSDYAQLSGRASRAVAHSYDLLLGRLVLRRADGVVAISRAAANFVRELSGRDVPVVYRGMRLEQLQAAPLEQELLRRAGGRPVVTFAGRLFDGKGVADLLQAFAALRDAPALLCIVGEGPRRQELEQLAARLGISEQVEFLGSVPLPRSWGVMRDSDIIVNPSYTEGLPTAVLEAALLGKPILATDVGGTSEIVTDGRGAFLFAAHDIDALRARLQLLLTDPGMRGRMGEAARAEATGRFDWQMSATRFMQIVRGLACTSADAAAQPADVGATSSTSSKTAS